jgi:signal transduction histidine kinase/CHASE3 domain sensor protein
MSFKYIFTPSFILKGVFVLSLFLLIFISGVSIKHTVSLTESNDFLVQSYRKQILLDNLLSSLKETESLQRGYIISRDSSFLYSYSSGLAKVDEIYNRLHTLVSNNRIQVMKLDSLKNLIDQRIVILNKSLQIVENPDYNKNLLDESLIAGRIVMEKIYVFVNEMIIYEMEYFQNHEEMYEFENKFTPIFTLMIFLFSLFVFVLSFLKIINDFENRKKTKQDLLLTTESFRHAATIGRFGIAQWDLKENKIEYSDNLYLLLGCKPQSFKAGIENFLKYVHPDDRHIISEGAEKVYKERKTFPRFYRVIRTDGEIRYFKSIGKFIQDDNNKMYISIMFDITQQHLINLALEERNHALEQSIKELESFNRVASHDLQEPLRKIQTFISRISENDKSLLSDLGRDQLVKVEQSARRMRILIDDLLLFSRTNKAEKEFYPTDLNILFENVKMELVSDIEENNVTIISGRLPMLNVISFQIQQLFINLLSNAIKYKRPDLPPVIKVVCKKINSLSHPALKGAPNKWYYKISVSDNGLGFEQKYAENIFILFQRLYHHSEYPGSGIGLAICKKIVENHNGFIDAESIPNAGSTFNIYLPEHI